MKANGNNLIFRNSDIAEKIFEYGYLGTKKGFDYDLECTLEFRTEEDRMSAENTIKAIVIKGIVKI